MSALSRMIYRFTFAPVVLLFALTLGLTSPAQSQTAAADAKCLICHSRADLFRLGPEGRRISLFVDTTVIRSSVHGKWSCTDCHSTVSAIPHQPGVPRVECTRCHFAGNRVGAPEGQLYDQYKESIHGVAALSGNVKAPFCQDCHGTHQIHHRTDPTSPIAKNSIAGTCGKCHIEETTAYRISIHGAALAQGIQDAPACSDCHGEHEIRARADPESKVNSENIPNTCSACHGEETLMGRYGVESVQVGTYEDSYHGIAVKFGQKQAANCASCHGVHDILPASDPRSRINVANIPETCGGCHQDANSNYARGRIHVDATKKDAGVIYYIASFFKYLTIGTLAVLILNILLDLRRKLSSKKHPK